MNKKSFWIKVMIGIILFLTLIGLMIWANSKSSCPTNPVLPLPSSSIGD